MERPRSPASSAAVRTGSCPGQAARVYRTALLPRRLAASAVQRECSCVYFPCSLPVRAPRVAPGLMRIKPTSRTERTCSPVRDATRGQLMLLLVVSEQSVAHVCVDEHGCHHNSELMISPVWPTYGSAAASLWVKSH